MRQEAIQAGRTYWRKAWGPKLTRTVNAIEKVREGSYAYTVVRFTLGDLTTQETLPLFVFAEWADEEYL